VKWVTELHKRNLSQGKPTTGVEKVIDLGALGFYAYVGTFDAVSISEIRNSGEVVNVEPDRSWSIDDKNLHRPLHDKRAPPQPVSQPRPQRRQVDVVRVWANQRPTPWALGSISHRTPHHRDRYVFDIIAGKGTFAYLIDSDIAINHPDFDGRAKVGYTHSTRELLSGHGTAVASTIAGWPLGVAQSATLVDVKIDESLANADDNPHMTTSAVLKGLAWAINNITAENRSDVSVINMSLNAGQVLVINTLVELAFGDGILCVAAAGNEPIDARELSPAGAPSAITVGAVDEDNEMMFNSSYGPGVDIFAPGVDVDHSVLGGGRTTSGSSGTSLAAGFISGLVLYLKSTDGAYAKAKVVVGLLKELATKDVITGLPEGTLNLLAFNGQPLGD